MADGNNCPVCGQPFQGQCKCERSDRTCKNGHEWHRCLVHHNWVVGKSDHSSNKCSCPKDGRKRPAHVPADATGWDETGWWTRDKIIPYAALNGIEAIPNRWILGLGLVALFYWLLA